MGGVKKLTIYPSYLPSIFCNINIKFNNEKSNPTGCYSYKKVGNLAG